MDKEEYRIKQEEINKLVDKKDYSGAIKVVDSIDWRKVKNVKTLVTVGEIYAANKRYKDSMDILLLAYQRAGTGKNILIRLAEVSLKGKYIDEAEDFYQRFEKIAPNDSRKYILKYKILKYKKAPLDQLIQELEKYKKAEFTEKWSYELAKVYYEDGQKEKCIDLCNTIILWFYDGKYVMKAMELKERLGVLSIEDRRRYNQYMNSLAMTKQDVNAFKPNKESTEVITNVSDKEKDQQIKEVQQEDTKLTADIKVEEIKVPIIEEKKEKKVRKTVKSRIKEKEVKNKEIQIQEIKIEEIKIGNENKKASRRNQNQDDLNLEQDFSDLEEQDENGKEPRKNFGKNFQVKIVKGIKEILSGKKKIFDDDLEDNLEDIDEDDFSEQMNIKSPKQEIFLEEIENIPKLEDEKDNLLQQKEEEKETKTEFFFKQPKDEARIDKKSEAVPDLNIVKQILEERNIKSIVPKEESRKSEVDDTEFQIDAQEELEDVKWVDDVEIKTIEDEQMVADIIKASEKPKKIENESDNNLKTEEKPLYTKEEEKIFAALEKSIERQLEQHLDKDIKNEKEDNSKTGREVHLENKVESLETEKEIEKSKKKEIDLDELVEEQENEIFESEEVELEEVDTTEATEDEIELEEVEAEEVPEEVELEEVEAEEVPEEVELEEADVEEVPEEEVKREEVPVKQVQENNKIVLRKKVLTEEESELFSYFAMVPGMKEQIVEMLCDMQQAATDKTSKTGNIIIMGARETGKTHLISKIIPAICKELNMVATKVAYVFAEQINGKDMAKITDQLAGGFLVIESANQLDEKTVESLNQAMEFRTDGLTVILEDEKIGMRKFLAKNPKFAAKFTSVINIPVFTNDELASFANVYTQEKGYLIEEAGMQSLYYLISQEQKEDEPMTVGLVKEILDDAISKSKRRKLFGKKKMNEDGFIILGERDFN